MATDPSIPSRHGVFGRLKGLLFAPSKEWERIAAQPMSTAAILGWAAVFGAIGPLAGMVESMIFGDPMLDTHVIRPLDYLATNALINWLLLMASTVALAFAANALAPAFGGRKDSNASLKLAAFGLTAWYLSGIANVVPQQSTLPFALILVLLFALLALGLYSFYILYAGLPVVMKAASQKTFAYIAVLFAVAVVLAVLSMLIGDWLMNQTMAPLPEGTRVLDR